MATKLTPESRQQQVSELFALQKEDATYQESDRWTEEARGRDDVKVVKEILSGGVTGTAVIDIANEEDIDRIRQELPQATILRDRPLELIQLELIQPEKSTLAYKPEGTLQLEDLWHLEKIGLAMARSQDSGGTGKDVTVAVLDTGIDSTHPALRGKVAAAYEFDPVAWEVKPMANSLDTEGHGTHVAGLICGNPISAAPDAKLLAD